MMRTVPTRRDIGNPEKGTESIIVKRVRGQEVLVLVVSSSGPEVPNLLRLDLLIADKWRTLKRRSGNLQDRQRRSVARKRLSDTRDGGNQRRK